jgi:hypothetical protein
MFEYNGKTFSLEMLEEKAKAEGISLDELLKANPDIKKIDDSGKSSAVANQAANATAVNEQIAAGQSTDLGSEDISLDLEKINKINENLGEETGATTNGKPLNTKEATDLTSYIDDLGKEKTIDEKIEIEKNIIKEISTNVELPNDYSELEESQKNLLMEQVASTLDNPSPSELDLKTSELFYKAQETKTELEDMSYGRNLLKRFNKGLAYVGENIALVPSTIYDVFAIPQNLLVEAGILPESGRASSEKFSKDYDLENPILEYFVDEQEAIGDKLTVYDEANYESTSPTENFSNGNYVDGFATLGNAIAESAPVSTMFMVGGAVSTFGKTAATMTVGLAGTEKKELKKDNPEMGEVEVVLKSLAIAGAESVFSALSQGTIGKVYKDIIFKQGTKAGTQTFKNGIISMYATALKKFGAPAAMLGEGIEEAATQITQNMIKGNPYFEGVADAFVIGMGSGGVYGAPISTVKAVTGVKNGITRLKIGNILKEGSGPNNVKETFKLFNKAETTTDQQIKIASMKNADVILQQDLTSAVENNSTTIR